MAIDWPYIEPNWFHLTTAAAEAEQQTTQERIKAIEKPTNQPNSFNLHQTLYRKYGVTGWLSG